MQASPTTEVPEVQVDAEVGRHAVDKLPQTAVRSAVQGAAVVEVPVAIDRLVEKLPLPAARNAEPGAAEVDLPVEAGRLVLNLPLPAA